MKRTLALFTLLMVGLAGVHAESRKFAQHAALFTSGSIEPESEWQEPLDRMLTLARARCLSDLNDLLTVIEEVVPEENIETGISRREMVRAFLSSRTAGKGVVVVGTLTVEQSNAQRVRRGVAATAAEREVEVEIVCTPK